jgi:preprotein translocase subunit SecB
MAGSKCAFSLYRNCWTLGSQNSLSLVHSMAKKKKAPARRRRLKVAKKPSFAAHEFIQHLQLKHIRLIDLQSHLGIRDGKLPNKAKIECSANVGPSSDGHIHANALLEIEGRPADGGESVVQIKAHYQCVYSIIDANLEQFSEHAGEIAKLGIWVLWPFFRELVQSITSKMELPTITLPVLVAGGTAQHVATYDDATEEKAAK